MLLPHKQEGLGYLLKVINLRPAFIAGSLPLDLLLNIDQQIEARSLMHLPAVTASDISAGTADGIPDILFGITVSQRTQADESLLIFSLQRSLLSTLDFISGCLQK